MQLVPYLGIDAACLDAHVKTLASSAQEFDLAPIARQSLPGLEVATEPSTRHCSKSSSDNRRYSNMAGMWLDRQGLAASRELAEISKGLDMGNAMVSESQLALLRSIDTPTVCNLIEIVAPERRGAGEPPALPVS